VDSDQVRTINFTDDGHVEADRGQGTSFVEDALPSADMNDTDESTSVSDVLLHSLVEPRTLGCLC
jgi:hypothetical protein